METKDFLLIAVVVIVAIAVRIVRNRKSSGSGFSFLKREESKKPGKSDKSSSEDDYEPYSGK